MCGWEKERNICKQLLPVSFKAFKTINIKDPNQTIWTRILTNGEVDFVNQPGHNRKMINDALLHRFLPWRMNSNVQWIWNLKKILEVGIYQLNKREYIILAKPSLLTVAPSGSRLLLIISPLVIIIRLHNAFSSASRSHLNWGWHQIMSPFKQEKVLKHNIIKVLILHEKLCCNFKMEFWLVIFYNRWIFFPLGKINITKMKNSSHNSEYCLLGYRERERRQRDYSELQKYV